MPSSSTIAARYRGDARDRVRLVGLGRLALAEVVVEQHVVLGEQQRQEAVPGLGVHGEAVEQAHRLALPSPKYSYQMSWPSGWTNPDGWERAGLPWLPRPETGPWPVGPRSAPVLRTTSGHVPLSDAARRFSTVHTDAQIGPPMLKVAATRGVLHLQLGRDLAEQLPGAPADHRDAGGADRVALGDQPARGVDRALAADAGLAVAPVPRPLAVRAPCRCTSAPIAPITVKQSCTSATLTSAGVDAGHRVGLAHGARYAPAGRSTSRPSFFSGSVAWP